MKKTVTGILLSLLFTVASVRAEGPGAAASEVFQREPLVVFNINFYVSALKQIHSFGAISLSLITDSNREIVGLNVGGMMNTLRTVRRATAKEKFGPSDRIVEGNLPFSSLREKKLQFDRFTLRFAEIDFTQVDPQTGGPIDVDILRTFVTRQRQKVHFWLERDAELNWRLHPLTEDGKRVMAAPDALVPILTISSRDYERQIPKPYVDMITPLEFQQIWKQEWQRSSWLSAEVARQNMSAKWEEVKENGLMALVRKVPVLETPPLVR